MDSGHCVTHRRKKKKRCHAKEYYSASADIEHYVETVSVPQDYNQSIHLCGESTLRCLLVNCIYLSPLFCES